MIIITFVVDFVRKEIKLKKKGCWCGSAYTHTRTAVCIYIYVYICIYIDFFMKKMFLQLDPSNSMKIDRSNDPFYLFIFNFLTLFFQFNINQ